MKNIDLRYYFEREIKNLHIQYADMQRHYTLCRKLITQSMADSEVQETVKQYIRTHMPSTDMYSVTEIIPENCTDVPFLANHISRYLVTNNMEYEDTLLGYYVSAEIRSVIMDTLNYIVPLKEGFELTTKQAGVSSTVADYNRFLRYILSKQKDLVVVIKNHPLYLQFREFYDVRSDKIQILIDQWCSLELGDTPSGDPRYMSLGEAAVLLDCTKETLIESLQAGWKYAQTDSFQILLEEEYVRKMYDDIRSLIEVDQYVKKIAEQNKMPWRCAKEVLDGFIATENPVWVMRGSEFPGKNAEQYYFFGKEEETARSAFSKLIQSISGYLRGILRTGYFSRR